MSGPSRCPRTVVFTALWAVSLGAAYLVAPRLLPSDDPSDVVTRQSARVAMLFWGIAAVALLVGRRSLGRLVWLLACLAYGAHVATAFDRVHGWSHGAAYKHVEDVSGFGPGIFVSYAFSLLWLADALWWWLSEASYDARPAWLDRAIHGFMAFIVFNGTVVYETGFIRWAGLGLFLVLGMLLVPRGLSPSTGPSPAR